MLKWIKLIWCAWAAKKWYVVRRNASWPVLSRVDVMTRCPGLLDYDVEILDGPFFAAEDAMSKASQWMRHYGEVQHDKE